MNHEILTKEVQDYISNNLSADIHKILLRKSPFQKVSTIELVEQIESKAKSRQKLPTWFNAKAIYYPNKLNLSQTSSEITADYKASLTNGDLLADITAGFGVDSVAFSKKMKRVVQVEKNEELSNIAGYNIKQLGVSNIETICDDGIRYLKNSSPSYDWIYIDPSRRDKKNKKVYYLADCEPNITNELEFLFSKSNNILIKTGPLLDIRAGQAQLNFIKEIHIIAVVNDVKEVLWVLEKNYKKEPLIKTVNFKNNYDTQKFQFKLSEESTTTPSYSLPQEYLYEPNAAILKSGAFQSVSTYYSLSKLHPNSHLYTSSSLITFPGRVFKLKKSCAYSKKSFKKLQVTKANITTRNFPDTVATIRKKLGVAEGGTCYVFCTTDLDNKPKLLICNQVFQN